MRMPWILRRALCRIGHHKDLILSEYPPGKGVMPRLFVRCVRCSRTGEFQAIMQAPGWSPIGATQLRAGTIQIRHFNGVMDNIARSAHPNLEVKDR